MFMFIYFNDNYRKIITGFHEAVGDTIALSVSSPKHLRRVELLDGDAEDEQTEINQLYKMVGGKNTLLAYSTMLLLQIAM